MDTLSSIAIIILSSLILGGICKKLKLPSLIGFLIVGIVSGPFVWNLISPELQIISSDLRTFALVIILTRAGLSLNLKQLKKVGRPAILLGFVPASIEILAYMLFGWLLLDISVLDCALLGSVMAAVSPAVVVPRMIKIRQQQYGVDKQIPQMIMASSSFDDIFVMVIFTGLLAMTSTGQFDLNILWQVPLSIVSGIVIGAIVGYAFSFIFKKIHIRDTVKLLIMLSFSFLFMMLSTYIKSYYSPLLSILSMGIFFYQNHEEASNRLSDKYAKIWVFAEIMLFVLIGSNVDFSYVTKSGGLIIAVIFIALIFRMIGVLLSVSFCGFNFKEKLFCMFAYMPKATVQAAIGAIPLGAGLACGQLVLTGAVLAILITAPIGAILTDISYKKLLKCNQDVYVYEPKAKMYI